MAVQTGKKWAKMAKMIETRTEHAVKNRYIALLKRHTKNQTFKSKGKNHK